MVTRREWALSILPLLFVGVALVQQTGRAQSGAVVIDALPYSLSYTVTGNYATSSVDFLPKSNNTGFQTEVLPMRDSTRADARLVPAGANVIAAWLYWETIWGDPSQVIGARFRGKAITLTRGVDTPLVGGLAKCGSKGDTLTAMRADVLPLLALELDENGNPTGRRLVNDVDLQAAGEGLNTVTLPERGTGNQTPQSAGATLVVVYQDPNPAALLRRVVVFDGSHVLASGESTTQRIRGFLQSFRGQGASAQLTHLVGSGGPNGTDQVLFNGALLPNGTGRISRAGGGSSDRAWTGVTFDVTAQMGGATVADDPSTSINEREFGEQVTSTITHSKANPYDCLAEAATIWANSCGGRRLFTSWPAGVTMVSEKIFRVFPSSRFGGRTILAL